MHSYERAKDNSSRYILVPQRREAEPGVKRKSNVKNVDTDAKKKRVLIVEDEALVAESLKDVIESAGYEIAGVLSTGEGAIQTASTTDLDVMIMDVRLAGKLNGIETVHAIHQFKPIPVLFLTAYAEDLYPQISIISQSLYKYISKPYAPSEIQEAIDQLLS